MSKKTQYSCNKCDAIFPAWSGKCTVCGSWGSIDEVEVEKKIANRATSSSANPAQRLTDIGVEKEARLISGISELDRVIGGGLVADSLSILTATPGAGKSTLLLELSKAFGDKDLKVLYASGEESESQIKARASRIMDAIPSNIWLISTNSMDQVLAEARRLKVDFLVVDSIQTMTLAEHASRPGSPVQTVECTASLMDLAKNPTCPVAVMMVGHMTKQNEMAGLRTLEHMVDTVLILSAEEGEDLRILSSTKNRFGRTGEIGIFKMEEAGIKEVTNPSEEFITNRDQDVIGSCVCMLKEGSRHIAVEVESLISRSFQAYPLRISQSISKDRLNTLIAILEERAGVILYEHNVILKTTGGLSLNKTSSDLAILMSIASSAKGVAIDRKAAYLGEVGLTGEVKPVKNLGQKIRELERMGYKKVYHGGESYQKIGQKIQSLGVGHIGDLIRDL